MDKRERGSSTTESNIPLSRRWRFLAIGSFIAVTAVVVLVGWLLGLTPGWIAGLVALMAAGSLVTDLLLWRFGKHALRARGYDW